MSLRGLLELLLAVLDEARLPYMLTGSLAGSYHGAPRATQDIDLVVDAPLQTVLDAARSLREAGLYVDTDAVREAHETRGMFNAVDPDSGLKIDFIIRKDRPFSRVEFVSRRTIDLWGMTVSIASAEDTVVAKLEWAKLAHSERQLRDVAEILAVQGEAIDLDKVKRWVDELNLTAQWDAANRLADPAE